MADIDRRSASEPAGASLVTHRPWLFPRSATPDGVRLLVTRALRGFADGAVSLIMVSYLTAIGFGAVRISAIVTGTLLGSATLTMIVGVMGDRISRRHVLLAACALMAATGLGFAAFSAFWPLMVVAIVGTLNPSNNDVSVFLPFEQAALAETVATRDLTSMYAWVNLAGVLAGGLGALASGVPEILSRVENIALLAVQRTGFLFYVVTACAVTLIYRRLSPAVDGHRALPKSSPLQRSRGIVIRLAILFSLDSFGGGLVVDSLLALWLFRRFGLSPHAVGVVFFAAGMMAAFSQLASAWLASRIGLINTMVFTHLPANLFLLLAGLMPTAPLAVTFILLRMLLSRMDVPARQTYVMRVVPPEERAAAASVTNVPRSLASGLSPMLTGLMLRHSNFGWPLICGGALKAAYDLLLLAQFRSIKPRD